jgi:trk system potassium uptake protein TrkA
MKQFAVIGLGRFGTSVATSLFRQGYDVLAIDEDEERTQKFSDEVTHVVQADSTDENALKALGIRNFDVVVVAIGEDIQANVMTTLLLKELGVPYVVAKAKNALHGRMLEKVGADKVVYPERDMGTRVAHNIISRNVLDYIELSPNLSIVEVTTPKEFIGKSLAEANLRPRFGINVVAIKRGDDLNVSPKAEDTIEAGDVLVVIGGNDGIQGLEELE